MDGKLDQVLKALQPPKLPSETHTPKSHSNTSVIKEVVQELAPLLASVVNSNKSSTYYGDEEEAKRVGRLVKRVAKFDGSKSRAITPWLTYMKRFFQEYDVTTERR